jgi:chromosome segregation ATPase
MRVLEGRRSRLEERLERMRTSLARTRERLDDYTLELQRHGMESVEREVRWLNELIESERSGRDQRAPEPAEQDKKHQSGDTGGLPRHRGGSRPDPSDDTTT